MSEGVESSSVVSAEAQIAAKQRQIMAIAWAPAKNLFTTAFMLYMSGTSIQLFSIMSTGMALFNPVKAIATLDESFKEFKDMTAGDQVTAKSLFVFWQLVGLGIALYHCSRMGLLPLTSADWTSFIPPKHILENSGIPI